MSDYTKAKLIKWAIYLAVFITGPILMAILMNVLPRNWGPSFFIAMIPLFGSVITIDYLFQNIYLEDVILCRFFGYEKVYDDDEKEKPAPKSDSERILELEKSVEKLQKKLNLVKILAASAIVFCFAICVYLIYLRS